MHHSIKDRLSSKILLARQWIERINHERTELLRDVDAARFSQNAIDLRFASRELEVWTTRLSEDLAIAQRRLKQDGYTLAGNGTLHDKFEDGVEYQFLPIFNDPSHNDPLDNTSVQVWQRKAVQS